MLNFRWSLIVLVAVFVAPPTAWAHFLWLARDARDSSQVKVYFSEVAEPDSPDLLDRVKKAQVWALTDRRGEPQLLPLSQKDDALVTALPVESARATVVLHHTYGVMTRGDNTFLLKYYSKAYASPLPGTWRPVNDGERLPLEITPTQEGDNVVLGVTWKGEPAKDVLVTVLGPGVNNEESTNENGVVRCRWEEEGVYSIRARLIETTQGEFEGKAYTEARHYSTLALHFAPKQIAPVAHNLPDLPQGITSLGAAISGDTLYLYGGNYGQAHEYSRDGQSGDLWKLNVKQPTQWERLPGGPKLQGLAMVEYQGMIYRVGGFTAMNQEGEPQDLRSQPDFARFDPRKQAWEELPAMPEPRSSHDAAVLDGILYVVGGWSLRGKDSETKWHDTALAIDLKSDPLQWKPIAAPPSIAERWRWRPGTAKSTASEACSRKAAPQRPSPYMIRQKMSGAKAPHSWAAPWTALAPRRLPAAVRFTPPPSPVRFNVFRAKVKVGSTWASWNILASSIACCLSIKNDSWPWAVAVCRLARL